jgi:hypothetical protein
MISVSIYIRGNIGLALNGCCLKSYSQQRIELESTKVELVFVL